MKTSEKLYNINAGISLKCVALKQLLSYDDIVELNKVLGEIIKAIRELEEENSELLKSTNIW